MQTKKFRNLGLADYKKAWDYKDQFFAKVASSWALTEKTHSGYLFFCEHLHVNTLGKSEQNINLLTDNDMPNCDFEIFYHFNSNINPYKLFDKGCPSKQKAQDGSMKNDGFQGVMKKGF
ncbi:MAG: hypothetical protein PHD06_02315 [Bacteroidales bacterium]|jgi:hypothetical protein|nr:hypothetical protein [Bacteroidales bacterium]MDD4383994.1 hypothetical protein [Bacteroidales bacterium]MDY0198085.1 hypothetical protein [Tenuifilaceae bacterium]